MFAGSWVLDYHRLNGHIQRIPFSKEKFKTHLKPGTPETEGPGGPMPPCPFSWRALGGLYNIISPDHWMLYFIIKLIHNTMLDSM